MERSLILFNKGMRRKAVKLGTAGVDWFNALPDWATLLDLDGTILAVNDAVVERRAYARKDLVGRAIADFCYDERSEPVLREWLARLPQGGSPFLVATMRDKDGKPVEVEHHGKVVALGRKKAVLVLARDVGAQRRDQRLALTLYEAFRRSNDVMFYTDRNGTILDVNEAFAKHYGWPREEAVGQNPRILRSRHSSDELYKRMWGSILSAGFWRGEMINKTRDGREIPLILTITAVRDEAGEIVGYISNAIDMAEHMALRARVADSEALASVGEMAAVVAHEIRNPLGSIVMAAKELAAGELPDADREVVMRVLRHESERLNEALSNFLAFARPRELKLARTDLNALIGEVVRAVESNPEISAGVKIRGELAPELKTIQIDADQIRQVVWNLVINALQALDGKGRLTVRTGRRDGRAFFAVSDTGPGIPEKARAALFKPFQTTKQKGTGLGLAVADRVVKAHGGEIVVDTGSGGTTFTVLLPSSGR